MTNDLRGEEEDWRGGEQVVQLRATVSSRGRSQLKIAQQRSRK